MPRVVLWDIGNVMVRWNPRTLYDKIFPEPVQCDRFLSSVCTMDWHIAHDLGVTFAENRARILPRFPEFEAEITAWETRWMEMLSGHIEETCKAMDDLHAAGVPQYVLSNMSGEVLDQITAIIPAWDRVAGRMISAEVGRLKPDPEIFHLACNQFDLRPADTLFIDDSAANIASAAALGFHTHHFVDPTGLHPGLVDKGLLKPV